MFYKNCYSKDINHCLAQRELCICDVILTHTLFKDIQREQSHKLSSIADLIDIKNKESIFFNGQNFEHAYFILRGKVKLHNSDIDSSKEYIYQILSQGDAIALENLYSDCKLLSYRATCIEDCKILTLDAKQFKKIINQDQTLLKNLLTYISNTLININERSQDLVFSEVSERLEKYLKQKRREQNSNNFVLDISKTELANLLGTIPATLSRAIKDLEKQRKIKVEKKNISLIKN